MSILFEPINIGGIEIPNRFVRSATHDGFSTVDGVITDESVAFIEDLAKGGVGLIVVGFAYVTPTGQAVPNQNAIYDDRFIAKMKQVTEAVHNYDSKVILQIGDSGSQSAVAAQRGIRPLAPSGRKRQWASFEGSEEVTHTEKGSPEYKMKTTAMEPLEMTEEQIERTINAYGEAARRVREAGFDGVQFHGGHGYLISEFASPATNSRTDGWGGPLENRMRFILSCYKSVRKTVGEDYPVMIKLGVEDQIEGGLKLAEGVEMARALAETGMDAIEVSEGVEQEPGHHIRTGVDTREKEAYYLDWAREVRKEVKIPLFLVGGNRSFDIMESIVEGGTADCISLCRALIREPHLIERFRKGDREIAKCISCNGCLVRLQQGRLECIFED